MKIDLLKLPSLPAPAIVDVTTRLFGVVIVLGAVVLASRWLTELTAPRPVAKLPSATVVQPESSVEMISRLFGAGEMQTQAIEGLRLTGVFVGGNGRGFATIHTRTGEVSVFPQADVAPGVKLIQIERDRVILLANGIQKELPLNVGGGDAAASNSIASGRAIPRVKPRPAHRGGEEE